MKRERRQHAMGRTELLLPPPWNSRMKNKVLNERNSPLAADFYAKVSSRPTNHCKFAGRCRKPKCMGCHLHHACKSRGKSKGAHKLKSYDVAVNHRLVAWRVVDIGVGLHYTGASASDMLRHLYGNHFQEIEEEEEEGGDERMVQEGSAIFGCCNLDVVDDLGPSGAEIEEDDEDYTGPSGADIEEVGNEDDTGPSGADIEVEDDIGFYYVGVEWDYVDDDGDWCVVGDLDVEA